MGDVDRIKNVAQRIQKTRAAGHQLVIVVSARSGVTNELIARAKAINDQPNTREMDMLLAIGEQETIALTAMALHALNIPAVSYTGAQAGIFTDQVFTKAKIKKINPQPILKDLQESKVVIVAGFQGINDEGQITTLGRGGSDLTAIALAAACRADKCEIYTDVDGVYTADPRIVKNAKKIDEISYDEMLELAASGAKVLHLRCVEYARRYNLPIHVRSSFSPNEGTWVVENHPEGGNMEQAIISGIAHDKTEAKVTIVGVPDRTGIAARIFQAIADADINIDMIVQNVSAAATGLTDISFTVPKAEGANATAVLKRIQGEVGFASIQYDDSIGKLSLVGAGMRSHPGVTATFFAAMAEAGLNIEMISTSEIRISIICRESDLEKGVRAAHTAFGLDADQVEAVVYGGSGR